MPYAFAAVAALLCVQAPWSVAHFATPPAPSIPSVPTPSEICAANVSGTVATFTLITSSSPAAAKATVAAITASLTVRTVNLEVLYAPPRDADAATTGGRLGVCGLELASRGLLFLRCITAGFVVASNAAKLAKPTTCLNRPTSAQALECLEQRLVEAGSDYYTGSGPPQCALQQGLDWVKLNQCANGGNGAKLLQASYKGAQDLLAERYEAKEEKTKGNQFTGSGGRTVVSRGGRRLLVGSSTQGFNLGLAPTVHASTTATAPVTSLFFSDINPLDQPPPPPPPGNTQQVLTALRHPPVVVLGDSVYVGAEWTEAGYTQQICGQLEQTRALVGLADDDLAGEALWAWLAGTALAFSSALAGVAVSCLYHFEGAWKAEDAFQRAEEDPAQLANRYQLVQLNTAGEVDARYESSLQVPNMPYLTAAWAQGSHKRFFGPDVEYQHNYRGMIHPHPARPANGEAPGVD